MDWYYYLRGEDNWYVVVEAHQDTDRLTKPGAMFMYESAAAAWCQQENSNRKREM